MQHFVVYMLVGFVQLARNQTGAWWAGRLRRAVHMRVALRRTALIRKVHGTFDSRQQNLH